MLCVWRVDFSYYRGRYLVEVVTCELCGHSREHMTLVKRGTRRRAG